ncbi:unnamed protein product [Prunus armeniaca]
MDILIDSTSGQGMLSFMDAFSGYNQIKMSPKDANLFWVCGVAMWALLVSSRYLAYPKLCSFPLLRTTKYLLTTRTHLAGHRYC